MGRAASLAAVALLAGLLTLAAGCGDDAEEAPDAATVPLDGMATPAPDIRQEDLTTQPALEEFLDSSGGEVDPARIVYEDLTEDGVEEAVVPVGSGGEGSDLAVFVFGYREGAVRELMHYVSQEQGLAAVIEDGVLVVSEPIYAEGDPLCCPSQLKVLHFSWDGSQLVLQDQAIESQGTPKAGEGD